MEWVHGVKVPDPYRWLESGDDPAVRRWVREQVAYGRDYLDRQPRRDALRRRLQELLGVDWKSPLERKGKRWFSYSYSSEDDGWVYAYRDSPQGPDRPAAIPRAAEGGKHYVVQRVWPSPNGRYVVFKEAPNGTDRGVLRLRDLDAGRSLESETLDGAYAYSNVVWMPDGDGFVYTWQPTDPRIAPSARFASSEVRYHRLGTPPSEDHTIIDKRPTSDDTEPERQEQSTRGFRVHGAEDGNWLVVRWLGTREAGIWVKDLREAWGPWPERELTFREAGFLPLMGGGWNAGSIQGWKNDLFVQTSSGAPRGRVVRIDPRQPQPRHWEEVVPEHSRAVLQDMRIAGDAF